MRNAVCCFFAFCTVAFGQAPQPNAAGDAIQKRVQGLDLVRPMKYRNAPVFKVAPVVSAKVCAIPLLRATGPGTNDSMPVMKPGIEPFRGELVKVPAPACDEEAFKNK